MFEQILRAVQEHDVIIIHRHANPDGDALGSQIGLKHILRDSFPGKRVYAVGDEAKRYAFMADSDMDRIEDSLYREALAVILDCSSPGLISDGRYAMAAQTVRIDHHIFLERIADIEVTDTSYESCCGLITAFAMECGLAVSDRAAEALYTGMITDSGRFRYDSTSANTFRCAAFLMERKIDTESLYASLYATSYEQMKLRAQYVLKIRFTPNNVAYICTSREELEALNADIFSISRGMVSVMADMKGVEIWANFTETDKGVLCELRSSRQNINPVAVKYGGGGHAKASGATVKDMDEAMRMLAELDAMAEN